MIGKPAKLIFQCTRAFIFASKVYLLHFVPYARNKVQLVLLACEDGVHFM